METTTVLAKPSAVRRLAPNDLTRLHFRLDARGLMPIGTPSYEEWSECGLWLKDARDELDRRMLMVQFAIGDWINYGEQRSWGEKYSQALDETHYDYPTLRNFAYVSRQVPLSLRSDKLTYSHHTLVAGLKTADERKEWLDYAEAEHKSVPALREEMRSHNAHGTTVKTAVNVLPATWRERATYLTNSRNDDESRAAAETYLKCADELTTALGQDRANGR